jgi:branched chain amino acid efflux pump
VIKPEYIYLLLAMGLVTYLPRWLPLFFLSDRKLPNWFVEWLDLIPAAILSALLIPELVVTGEARHLDLFTPELLVAIPTFIFASFTKSLGGTVVIGMILYWLVGQCF